MLFSCSCLLCDPFKITCVTSLLITCCLCVADSTPLFWDFTLPHNPCFPHDHTSWSPWLFLPSYFLVFLSTLFIPSTLALMFDFHFWVEDPKFNIYKTRMLKMVLKFCSFKHAYTSSYTAQVEGGKFGRMVSPGNIFSLVNRNVTSTFTPVVF